MMSVDQSTDILKLSTHSQGDQIGQNFLAWVNFFLEKNRPIIWAKF
jgi:hypothetical protein